MYIYTIHGYKNVRHEDAPPPHSHMHIIHMWQSRIKMQIISEVKVKKMAIEVDIQMHDVCWVWWFDVYT